MNLARNAAQEKISRVRRDYNQWVNNQTLEDFSLRFTAKSARRWSFFTVANTALGTTSFLALEAIGAAVTLSYGFENTFYATLIVSLIILFAGIPVTYYCARYGVDIDLLTRGAGFGYIGSTITSLIYASFTFIFFALEAAIMAKALELMVGLPLVFGYVASSIVIIPLAFFGITFLNKFQFWTQPIWILLHAIPVFYVLLHEQEAINNWLFYSGESNETGRVDLLLIGASASVMFALVAQIGEQVDIIRFLPTKTKENQVRWWIAMLTAGPGWIIVGGLKILFGSFLAFFALSKGLNISNAADPTHMYLTVFDEIFHSPVIALLLAGLFVIVSQLKINVTNAYAGSIAWSNFFSRLTHSHPGRVAWLVFNVSIALVLMELGVYRAFENTLSVYAIVAVAWMGCLVADLVINKPLGLSTKHIEFKRAHLHDINPVGVGSMILSSAIGVMAFLGVFGHSIQPLAHFITIVFTLVLVPLLSVVTRSKYYIARESQLINTSDGLSECCVCLNCYENEDIAVCPAYAGPICSLCCSLDTRCLDVCKSSAESIGESIYGLALKYPFAKYFVYINKRFLYFVGMLLVIAGLLGILLALIFNASVTGDEAVDVFIENAFWKVFVILMIVAGVVSWLFVLSRETRIVAQQESQRQTHRLLNEINAHGETDKKLQQAKEVAEAANNAKSRYLTGLSHELRTPLNSVLGYAQLLENNDSFDKSTKTKISTIKRSSEHLADLIEGLLDISKIEAGKIEVNRESIHLTDVIDQIVSMFRLQASDKGLDFHYRILSPLPDYVAGDEKRLRQILINLLSNAIKFTTIGHVTLAISYKNQVAKFYIVDSGNGIPEDEMERIFLPFERVRRPGTVLASGTGLGLAITRLLVDIMGGDIAVENNKSSGQGATFTLSLMLTSIDKPTVDRARAKRIYGYVGHKRSVMIVDDDASHRALVSDFLAPLGFIVFEAYDGFSCLELLQKGRPDLFLLDRMMPGMTGPELAAKIRKSHIKTPIIMVSANANEDMIEADKRVYHNDYLSKPIKMSVLLEKIGIHLEIDWIFDNTQSHIVNELPGAIRRFPPEHIRFEINDAAEMGNLSMLKKLASQVEANDDACDEYLVQLNRLISQIQPEKIIALNKGQSIISLKD